ncbi:hypothetical protein FNF27_08045 [Cafeteria roenbergensis]|uniref:Fatty acid hydroxylase domain-containing protein n=1 Tax=Cafeteria roenbergensis TaxID=33653 RepID=A0A5A8C5W2_CAFRO|nr:hypothetical protein FNF31_07625 [Cafeteria roenbergensis]KAA0162592.1 hypothetical protein FNF27_08045 [Cafeteria roenbergensis]
MWLVPSRPALTLLDQDQGQDKYWTTVALTVVGYMIMYLVPAAAFEATNPKPKTPQRIASIGRELQLGVLAMLVNTGYAVFWMTVVEQHTPFYGFFDKDLGGHEFSPMWLVGGFVVYLLAFDFHFLWTHYVLHTTWCFRHVHSVHHNFVNPTAFAQDAVHPLEGVLQGPMGHYFCALVFPMHPVAHAVFGFLTSLYAIAAHDGRAWDLSGHTQHHHHKDLNFGLYGCWDCVCNSRFSPGYNGTVRGLLLTRHLQFQDVFNTADLTAAMQSLQGTDRLRAARHEIEDSRARAGGHPAVHDTSFAGTAAAASSAGDATSDDSGSDGEEGGSASRRSSSALRRRKRQ